jgi:uncharacterized protein (TIGR02145 family)
LTNLLHTIILSFCNVRKKKKNYKIVIMKKIFIKLGVFLTAFIMFASCQNQDPFVKGGADAGTVSDIDGNVYHTIKIGTQTWMVENLKTTKFRNGESITNRSKDSLNYPCGLDNAASYTNYDNDSVYGRNNGRLYNGLAVSDTRNIAPAGWHVSTDADWNKLEQYLLENGCNWDGKKDYNKLAKSLADTNTDTLQGGWLAYNGDAPYKTIGVHAELNNKSGLKIAPTGLRDYVTFKESSHRADSLSKLLKNPIPMPSIIKAHYEKNTSAYIWSPDLTNGYYTYRYISNSLESSGRVISFFKANFYAVRCVKD